MAVVEVRVAVSEASVYRTIVFIRGHFSTFFFLDLRLLDKNEKDTLAAVLDFCRGTRRNLAGIACSSWSFLDTVPSTI